MVRMSARVHIHAIFKKDIFDPRWELPRANCSRKELVATPFSTWSQHDLCLGAGRKKGHGRRERWTKVALLLGCLAFLTHWETEVVRRKEEWLGVTINLDKGWKPPAVGRG